MNKKPILQEAWDKIDEQQERIKDLERVLTTLYQDAHMALDDDWDRTDDGFQCQIDIIEEVMPDLEYDREKVMADLGREDEE